MPISRHVAYLVCVMTIPLSHAESGSLLPPFPPLTEIRAGEQTPSAQLSPDGLDLPITFSDTTERVYWDLPLVSRIPSGTTALDLEISCTNAAPLRGISVHLQSGEGWYNASPTFSSGVHERIALPSGLFQPEGSPGPWQKSRLLRISAWKKKVGTTSITLHGVQARTDTIALVRATEVTAPGETALAAIFTDRCARLLSKAKIPFAVIDDTLDRLDSFTLLFLPYAPVLPNKQITRLERFVKRKGKLIVFYNASEPLGNLLGVRPGTWQRTVAGQEWTALNCDTAHLTGAPGRIPHITNNILPPFFTPQHHARLVATWVDDTGRVTDLPACVLSDRGAWFAHVPPLAYPSAVSFLSVLTQNLSPDLKIPSSPAPLPTDALRQTSAPLPGIRAAWNTSPTARHPRGWDGLMQNLSANGINTLFIHWQSAGSLFHERKGTRPAGTLTEALEAGAKHGISVHAWVTCWTLEGAEAALTAQLTQENRLMRDASGNTLPWLCPSIPANRELLLGGIRNLARLGIQGIHLDYVRYPEDRGCFAPATRQAFQDRLGASVSAWPADVLPGGQHAAAFQKFRRDTITSFVEEAHTLLHTVNPSIRISAAVFPTPDAAASRGQDWPAWIRSGLIDFACPMIYTENTADFAASLDACLAVAPASTLVPGLGTGADDCQLDVSLAATQLALVRSHHLAGLAFFAVDDELLTAILPGLFRK